MMMLFLTGCGKKDNIVIYTSMEEQRNKKLKEMGVDDYSVLFKEELKDV